MFHPVAAQLLQVKRALAADGREARRKVKLETFGHIRVLRYEDIGPGLEFFLGCFSQNSKKTTWNPWILNEKRL